MNQRMRSRPLALAVLLCLPTLAQAVGALAVDSRLVEGTIGHGMVTGFANATEAQQEALKACNNEMNTRCKVVLTFTEACAAYAWSRESQAAAAASTLQRAEELALQNCQAPTCKISVSACE